MVGLMEHAHGKAVQDAINPLARNLRRAIPDTYAGFAGLHKAAMSEGVLPKKTKELIALAIAVTEQCDGCIASHARGAVRADVCGRADLCGRQLMCIPERLTWRKPRDRARI